VIAALRPWCEKFPGAAVVETVPEGRVGNVLPRAPDGAGLVVVGRRAREARLGPHISSVAHAKCIMPGAPSRSSRTPEPAPGHNSGPSRMLPNRARQGAS